MKLGFIIPTFPGERRVALLPEHIENFDNEIIIEKGFGSNLDIADMEYEKKGCNIQSREEIFKSCDAIFCLKLLQESDYKYLRKNQLIIGWTHPTGSGTDFFNTVAQEKELCIVDLDNIFPRIFIKDKVYDIADIPKNFVWKNSYNAGAASTMHGLLSYGLLPNSTTKIAVLAPGSTSQGAYNQIAKYNADVRLFYRKTMDEFKDELESFDVIINGIEVDGSIKHIISKEELKRVKKKCLIIDAAADAGNAIEGTRYTSIQDPIYCEDGIYYYVVNNAPSIIHRTSSHDISESFSKWVYKHDVKKFLDIIKK